MKKLTIVLTILCFLITNILGAFSIYAQEFRLPAPGVRVNLSPEFNPPILKGIKVHQDSPFRFDFILDRGDESRLPSNEALGVKQEATKLIKYFLASLTIPENDLWVNLSPYEKDRIIPQSFGLTEMGRDLLAEDYMLKQVTASLIYPEDEIGRKFWKRIYEEAARKFGRTDIPVNTFNKVWIVPEKAVVYENVKAGTAYVIESKLKVMLEEDYLALSKNFFRSQPKGQPGDMFKSEQQRTCPQADCQPDKELRMKTSQGKYRNDISSVGANILREIVIPELTREVNENKNFARLRQVYNSLILATWYKKKIKDSILLQVYADKKKVAGVMYEKSGNNPRNDTELIYQRYLQAFKKGVYNYIKEEAISIPGMPSKEQGTLPRKYFSGGLDMALTVSNYGSRNVLQVDHDPNLIPLDARRSKIEIIAEKTDMAMSGNDDKDLIAAAESAETLERQAMEGSFEQRKTAFRSLVTLSNSKDYELAHKAFWNMYAIIDKVDPQIVLSLAQENASFQSRIVFFIVYKIGYTSPNIFRREFLYSIWKSILTRLETYELSDKSFEGKLIGAFEAYPHVIGTYGVGHPDPFEDLISCLHSPLHAAREKAIKILGDVPYVEPLGDFETSGEWRKKWISRLHTYLDTPVNHSVWEMLREEIQSNDLDIQKQGVGRWFEVARRHMFTTGQTVPLKNWTILEVVAKQVASASRMNAKDFQGIALAFFGGGITPHEMDAVVIASPARRQQAKVFAEALRERIEGLGFEIDIAAIGDKNEDLQKQELVITSEEFKHLMSQEEKTEVRQSALLKGRCILGDKKFFEDLTNTYAYKNNDLDHNGKSLYQVLTEGKETVTSSKPEIRLLQIISWLGLVYARNHQESINEPTNIPMILQYMQSEGLLSDVQSDETSYGVLRDAYQRGIKTRALLDWKDEGIENEFEIIIWGDGLRYNIFNRLKKIKNEVLERVLAKSPPDAAMNIRQALSENIGAWIEFTAPDQKYAGKKKELSTGEQFDMDDFVNSKRGTFLSSLLFPDEREKKERSTGLGHDVKDIRCVAVLYSMYGNVIGLTFSGQHPAKGLVTVEWQRIDEWKIIGKQGGRADHLTSVNYSKIKNLPPSRKMEFLNMLFYGMSRKKTMPSQEEIVNFAKEFRKTGMISTGTYYLDKLGAYFYNKRKDVFENKIEAQNALRMVRILTAQGLFYPGTIWGLCAVPDNKFGLWAVTPALVGHRGFLKIPEAQREYGRFDLLKDRWIRRVEPEYRTKEGLYDNFYSLVYWLELEHDGNWGWDNETDTFYPIDLEVVDFRGLKQRRVIEKILSRISDNAQLGQRVYINDRKGGIDLTPGNLNLQTRGADSRLYVDSGSIQFNLDPAMLVKLKNAPGFEPEIINIQFVTSLDGFLEISERSPHL